MRVGDMNMERERENTPCFDVDDDSSGSRCWAEGTPAPAPDSKPDTNGNVPTRLLWLFPCDPLVLCWCVADLRLSAVFRCEALMLLLC